MGYPKRSPVQKKELERSKKRVTRDYDVDCSTTRHRDLIENLTKDDVHEYERWLHKWGTPGRHRSVMVDQMKSRNVTGALLELANLRNDDLLEHQKVIQAIRSRWYDIQEHYKQKINSNSDLFWTRMAKSIIRRGKTGKINVEPSWMESGGHAKLVEFLRTLYEKQVGCCALSKEQMILAVGNDRENTQKCSPDRINSDKGYEIGNIQLTVWWVNAMKSDFTTRQFYSKIRTLAKSIGVKDTA